MTKTVKVRIAVAVDGEGDWDAVGWSLADQDDQMMSLAYEAVGPDAALYWVTAELPVPEPVEVEGEVERG